MPVAPTARCASPTRTSSSSSAAEPTYSSITPAGAGAGVRARSAAAAPRATPALPNGAATAAARTLHVDAALVVLADGEVRGAGVQQVAHALQVDLDVRHAHLRRTWGSV